MTWKIGILFFLKISAKIVLKIACSSLLFLHLPGHFIYLCKIWQSYLFLYPLLDIKWSYLYTANRYNVVSLLSFNKRNHTMLLQNFNGLNFFSCNFVYFHRKGWCLINVICVCLRIMVPTTYCVVHMFLLSLTCVQYCASFSRFSILIVPSVFSNIYYLYIRSTTGKSLTLEICCILNYAPQYKR